MSGALAYQPLPGRSWNRATAAHLLRRAGFGGTPDDLALAIERGMDDTVAWLTELPPADDPLQAAAGELHSAFSRNERAALRGRWVWRMINTPRPLEERMTLFWHGHFATSLSKVGNADWMRRQNATLRRHATGSFGALLLAVSRDPAMLRWLDNDKNVKGRPNENYARELFELFSLGIGHYTEQDVQQAARAFTGWRIRGDEFFFDPAVHDGGSKTIFDQQGAFGGEEVVRLVLERKQCARFLATKLLVHFVFDDPPAGLVDPLAERIRGDRYELRGALAMLFRSAAFYSPRARLKQIKSPAQLAVGAVQALMAKVDPAALAGQMARMGQDLFHPPDVKGWDGGRAWISSSLLFARQEFARALVLAGGGTLGLGPRTDLTGPLDAAGVTTPRGTVDFYLARLLPDGASPELHARLVAYLRTAQGPRHRQVAELVHLILSSPEYQLA